MLDSETMVQGSPQFETTLWSEVLLAAREPDSNAGRKALARLCNVYWYPVYAFIRRQGARPEDAQDHTQGFFEHILTNGFFARADPERGRFRSFLLGAVRHYLLNERDRATALRRGGSTERVCIDSALAEHWLSAEPSSNNDSTRAFDRSWALALINRALVQLEEEQIAAGRGTHFSRLKEFLQRSPRPGEYDVIAKELGSTKGAVAAAVHRLNERYGELARKAVRETVAKPEMADEELRFLYAALQG